MMLKRTLLVALMALTGPAVAQPAKPEGPAAATKAPLINPAVVEKAKESVDKGLHFLRSKQAENGSYGDHVGLTAMTLLAFAQSHRAYRLEDGPFISRAAEWLAAQARADGAITGEATPVYNTALAVMALHTLDKVKYKKVIEGGQRFLAGDQADEDQKYQRSDKYYGGIGYGGDERPDLSNLQYALDALRLTDYDPNSDVWSKAQLFVTRCQNRSESNDQAWAGNDGGFIYEPGQSKAGATASYGAMTFAGVKSLLHTQAKKDDPRVVAAFDWIKKNYDFNQHPGMGTTSYYYYLQTAAGALDVFGELSIPDSKGRARLWPVDLIERLASLQKPDGSWINDNKKYWEDNPILATSRAVISLNHAVHAAK